MFMINVLSVRRQNSVAFLSVVNNGIVDVVQMRQNIMAITAITAIAITVATSSATRGCQWEHLRGASVSDGFDMLCLPNKNVAQKFKYWFN